MSLVICFRGWRALSFLAVALTLLGEAWAHGDNVLFIGNSFTMGGPTTEVSGHGGVPAMIAVIAKAKGKTLTTQVLVANGKSLRDDLASPTTDATLVSGWDCVVLQDASIVPTRLGNPDGFLKSGQELYDLIVQDTPQARVVLFETWARGPKNPIYTGVDSPKSFKNYDEMHEDLQKAYQQLTILLQTKDPARSVSMAPVGTAFAMCQKGFPSINLYARDFYHASVEGNYLIALVLYATIFHDSPVGAPAEMPGFTLSPDEAKNLQTVAQAATSS